MRELPKVYRNVDGNMQVCDPDLHSDCYIKYDDHLNEVQLITEKLKNSLKLVPEKIVA